MSDNFGRSIVYALAAFTIIITISVVGGLPFIIAALVLSYLYYNGEESRNPNGHPNEQCFSGQGVWPDSARHEASW